MYWTGDIVDYDSGNPIPRATVTVLGSGDRETNELTIADDNGHYALLSFVLLSRSMDGPGQLKFTSVGYEPVIISPYEIDQSNAFVQLHKSYKELDSVTVTPKKKISGTAFLLYTAAAAVWSEFKYRSHGKRK